VYGNEVIPNKYMNSRQIALLTAKVQLV